MQLRTATLWASMASLASPTAGADLSDAEFGERVRAYLLEHPEVVLEAMEALAAQQASDEMARAIAEVGREVFEPPTPLVIGPVDAPRVIVEYFDYACGPCRAVHPEVTGLVAARDDLRVLQRHLPILSPGSERAARLVLAAELAAGEAAAQALHAAFFAYRGPLSREALARLVREEGLDPSRLEALGDTPAVNGVIERNRDVAVQLGLVGTPAFVAPRQLLVGRPAPGALAALVD